MLKKFDFKNLNLCFDSLIYKYFFFGLNFKFLSEIKIVEK